jgi:S-phase kinase-associated protein 1
MAATDQKTAADDQEEEEIGGLDDDDSDTLILVSSEDDNPREFEISRKAALMCNLVKSILEGDSAAKKIPIKKVRGDILELIVEYLKHHNGKKPDEIAKPIRSVKMERIVADKWDADYINKMNKKTIFQVILGANYMDLPSLLHLGCAKIATLIKGKSPEEIKNILADDSGDNQDENKDDK